jgi:hypothetical protein
MKWNKRLLRQEIEKTTIHLIVLKGEIRASGHLTTNVEGRDLAKLKKQATLLCSIAAHSRGKLHLTSRWSEVDRVFYPLTEEDQQKLIEKDVGRFRLPDEPLADSGTYVCCGAGRGVV